MTMLTIILLSLGLIGVLMLMMTVLAFLMRKQKINQSAGVLIIVGVLLMVMPALAVQSF